VEPRSQFKLISHFSGSEPLGLVVLPEKKKKRKKKVLAEVLINFF